MVLNRNDDIAPIIIHRHHGATAAATVATASLLLMHDSRSYEYGTVLMPVVVNI